VYDNFPEVKLVVLLDAPEVDGVGVLGEGTIVEEDGEIELGADTVTAPGNVIAAVDTVGIMDVADSDELGIIVELCELGVDVVGIMFVTVPNGSLVFDGIEVVGVGKLDDGDMLFVAVNISKVGLSIVSPEITPVRKETVGAIVVFASDTPPCSSAIISPPCCGTRVLSVGDIEPNETVTLDVCTPLVAEMPDCVCGVNGVTVGSIISKAGDIEDISDVVAGVVGEIKVVNGEITKLDTVIKKVSTAEATPINDTHITHKMRKTVLLISITFPYS